MRSRKVVEGVEENSNGSHLGFLLTQEARVVLDGDLEAEVVGVGHVATVEVAVDVEPQPSNN